jgi:hypothetical protein
VPICLPASVHDVGPLFESEVDQLFERISRTLGSARRPARTAESYARLLDGSASATHHIPANPLPITQN